MPTLYDQFQILHLKTGVSRLPRLLAWVSDQETAETGARRSRISQM
jgi:hypothetical protein